MEEERREPGRLPRAVAGAWLYFNDDCGDFAGCVESLVDSISLLTGRPSNFVSAMARLLWDPMVTQDPLRRHLRTTNMPLSLWGRVRSRWEGSVDTD